jgi:hypothetical protein
MENFTLCLAAFAAVYGLCMHRQNRRLWASIDAFERINSGRNQRFEEAAARLQQSVDRISDEARSRMTLAYINPRNN